MFRLISMYTSGTKYQEEFEKTLKPSLDIAKFPSHVYPVSSRGSWEENCQIKAEVILSALTTFKEDIVWTDVDSEITKYPVLFDNFNYELAFHKIGSEYLSGTLFLKNCDICREFVLRWVEKNKENSKKWDQVSFGEVVEEYKNKISMYSLPSEYCYIFDHPIQKCQSSPVFIHYQASRRLKRDVK